ncbi:MAG: hypothetical protein IJU41_09590, partial [Clostridia bacterium]|nr:hypothetical protein [Clostridia bacterium]
MKKTKLLFIALCLTASLIFVLTAAAADMQAVNSEVEENSGTCGETVFWSFDADLGILHIFGEGPTYDFSTRTSAPWYSLAPSVQQIDVADTVELCGDYALYGCCDEIIRTTIQAYYPAADFPDGIARVELAFSNMKIAASAIDFENRGGMKQLLGKTLTLYVKNLREGVTFSGGYHPDPAKSNGVILYTQVQAWEIAENFGDDGVIKCACTQSDSVIITLGSKVVTHDNSKNTFEGCDALEVYTWDSYAVAWVEIDPWTFEKAFLYDEVEGEYVGNNSYGRAEYTERVTTVNGKPFVTLVVHYTPYEFARFFVRSLKDATTAQKADFVTIGKYGAYVYYGTYDGIDEKTYFQEYLIGTNVRVTSDDQVVSKKNGEKAKSVKLIGQALSSGEFFFGYYNAADNILEVAKNCGAFKTGRMLAKNDSRQTVKIDGTTYNFGFKGVADAGVPAYDYDLVQHIIECIEPGKDNVKYILVDGNVVYVEDNREPYVEKFFDYVVADFNGEYLEAALGLKEGRLAEKLTYGFYVVDGEVRFAVLDMTTGKWKLATLAAFNYGWYDEYDDEFECEVDNLATLAVYASVTTLTGDGKADFEAVSAATAKTALFAVVDEQNGAYTLAPVYYSVRIADHDGTCIDRLCFSDDSPKTSKITSDKDVEPARVTLNKNSLVILLNTDNGKVGIRKGVQKEANSVNADVTFYSATSDLIFGTVVGFHVEAWEDAKAGIDENATYYVVTADSSFALETSKDGDDTTYTATADGLFDLRTGKVVNGIVEEAEKKADLKLYDAKDAAAGTVIYFDGGEDYEVVELTGNVVAGIAKANDADDNDYTALNLAKLIIEDSDTVTYTGGRIDDKTLSAADAYNLRIKVTTVMTGAFSAHLNTKEIYTDLNGCYDDVAILGDNDEYYKYALEGDTVEQLTAPTEGVFDQFIIDAFVNGAHIYAPAKDEDPDFGNDEQLHVQLCAAARFERGTVYIEVIRIVTADCDYPTPVCNRHLFDNCADLICNRCGYVRDSALENEHVFGASCDAVCNVCGYIRTTAAEHHFQYEAETAMQHSGVCTVCGEQIALAWHIWDENSACTLCGYACQHQFDMGDYGTCIHCGHYKSVTIISCASVTAPAGTIATVPVQMTDASGIVGMQIEVQYDAAKLEYRGAEKRDSRFMATFSSPGASDDVKIVLVDLSLTGVTGDAELAALQFAVSGEAANTTADVRIRSIYAYDADFNPIDVRTADGVITVEEALAFASALIEIPAVAPTCTTAGNNLYYYCAGCETYFADAEGTIETTVLEQTIPATGHTPVELPAVAATCTSTGLTAGSKCSVCNTILVAQEVIPATGEHNYIKGALVSATRTSNAYYPYTCSVCG